MVIADGIDIREGCPECGGLMFKEYDGGGVIARCWSGCSHLYDKEPDRTKVGNDFSVHTIHMRETTTVELMETLANPCRRWPAVNLDIQVKAWKRKPARNHIQFDVEGPEIAILQCSARVSFAQGRVKRGKMGAVSVCAVAVNYNLDDLSTADIASLRVAMAKAIGVLTGRAVGLIGKDSVDWEIDAPKLYMHLMET